MRTSAWKRADERLYLHGAYPFGACEKCGKRAACMAAPAEGGGSISVCLPCKPDDLVFSPFYGQQTKIFESSCRWVLAGGGAGGSKTFAGIHLFLKQYQEEVGRWLRGEIRRSKGYALYLRRESPSALQAVQLFKSIMYQVDPGVRWDATYNTAEFTCGFSMRFGSMKDDDSYLNYQGPEYTLVIMDEATEFTVEQIRWIDTRIRCADPVLGAKVQLYLLTNPVGGATKAYLKRRFVDQGEPEVPVYVNVKLADGREMIEQQVYIPSNVYDNPALMEDGRYEANIRSKGEMMTRVLLENDWGVTDGLWLGDDWQPEAHVRNPFAIPKSWRLTKCADYGFGSQSSILWIATSPEGAHFCYRSLATRGMTALELAELIKRIESQPLTWRNPTTGGTVVVVSGEWDVQRDCSTVFGPMDSAVWARVGEASLSRGETFDRIGCGFHRSIKSRTHREDAADQIRTLLRKRIADAEGKPTVAGLSFFSTCRNQIKNANGEAEWSGPIETLPVLEIDKTNPETWDTDGNDHDCDALAYWVLENADRSAEHGEDAQIIDFFVVKKQAAVSEPIEW